MTSFQHPVLSLNGKPSGSVDLLSNVFQVKEINTHLIWEAVRHFLAKRRAGTAKTKDKWEVSGSGRKLWKQKEPAALVWDPFVLLCGRAEQRFMDLTHVPSTTHFRRRLVALLFAMRCRRNCRKEKFLLWMAGI